MVVKHVASGDEFNSIVRNKDSSSLVVVDYFAVWCGPCKRIAPQVDEMSNTFEGAIFLKVDVDELEEVARQENVTAMPTFKLYKRGEQVGELVGASADKLRQLIKDHM